MATTRKTYSFDPNECRLEWTQRLTRVETTLVNINLNLVEIKQLLEKQNGRISKNESWRYKIMGATTILTIIVTIVLKIIFKI